MEIENKKLAQNNLLMKVNRKLGKKKSVILICISVFVLLLILENYIVNIISCSLQQKYDNIFSLANMFKVDFKYISQNEIVKFFYIVFISINIIITARLAYNLRTSFADFNIGQKGTSRFTTIQEIKEQYNEVPYKDDEYEGLAGIPVSMIDNKFYIDVSNTNNLILGITRSGKGEMFVVPFIDICSRSSEKPSLVILDMKLELVCRSYKTLIKRGYEVYVLNIADPSFGVQFNPLSLIVKNYLEGNKSDAELLCNSFAYSLYSSDSKSKSDNSEFFLNNATSALSALILAHIEDCDIQDMRDNAKAEMMFLNSQIEFNKLPDELKKQAQKNWDDNKPEIFIEKNLSKFPYIPPEAKYIKTHENIKKVTVPSVVNTFTELARTWIDSRTTQLDLYFQKRPSSDRAKAIYSSIEVAGGDKTKGSIFSQALTKLNFYMYENITKLTSKSTFDLESLGFGEKPVALFIGVPFYDRSKDSIVSTLIEQAFQANARRASVSPGQKCKRRIMFHLDEIGNYPAIKDFKSMISVGLGCNMIFNLFLQSLSQMDSVYGTDDAKTIRGNMGNQIYIQSSLYECAEEFSKMIGNETITSITRMGKKMELSKSFTEMQDERPLLTPVELTELRPGENVIKRVMKRTDLKGNKIKPYPIFNSLDTGTAFKYSYEYLSDKFPTNVSLSELNLPSVSDDTVPEFYNPFITLNKYVYEHINETIKHGTEEDIEGLAPEELLEYEKLKKYYKYDIKISDIPNFRGFIELAKDNKLAFNEQIMLGEFIDIVVCSTLDINMKQKILNKNFIDTHF